jgi:hypothetical protein
VWPVLLVDASTFLVSVVLVLGVARDLGRPEAAAQAKARSQGIGGAVADGLRLIARSRPLIAALGGVSVTMLGVGAASNVLSSRSSSTSSARARRGRGRSRAPRRCR